MTDKGNAKNKALPSLNLNEQKSLLIQQALEEASRKGLNNVQVNCNDNALEIQGKDKDGSTFSLSRKMIGTGDIFSGSRYPKHRNQKELKYNCQKLYKAGYTQVQIAKMLGISQSRVSQILNEK